MADAITEEQYLRELDAVVRKLAELLPAIESKIGKPDFVPIASDPSGQHFRYANPNERTIQFLLLVRIVSGLHATLLLLKVGHIIEAGVLLRTIDDFCGDYAFVEEALRSPTGPNATQKAFIDNYFLETSDPLKKHVGRSQKVRAAEGRFLKPEDPHDVVYGSKQIDNIYDAHVHGDYGPVMDIYVARRSRRDGFEVLGVSAAEALSIHRLTLATYVQRAYSLATLLCMTLGLREQSQMLFQISQSIKGKDAFEIP